MPSDKVALYPKIVAKALLFDGSNHVLVLRRSPSHPNFPGHLDFPGGEVEAGEQGDQAVAREIKEETNHDIVADDLLLVYEKQVSENVIHMIYKGRIESVESDMQVSWEHSSAQWLSINYLKELSVPVGADGYYMTVLEYLTLGN